MLDDEKSPSVMKVLSLAFFFSAEPHVMGCAGSLPASGSAAMPGPPGELVIDGISTYEANANIAVNPDGTILVSSKTRLDPCGKVYAYAPGSSEPELVIDGINNHDGNAGLAVKADGTILVSTKLKRDPYGKVYAYAPGSSVEPELVLDNIHNVHGAAGIAVKPDGTILVSSKTRLDPWGKVYAATPSQGCFKK